MPTGLKTAAIGSSAGIRVGDRVTAVGNAGGTGTLTVSTGTLTRLHQSITVSDDQGGATRLSDLIETSAQLQPGDSGGPLLDSSGRVIGVDAAGSSGSRFQQSAGDGYAIPINTATAIVHQIEAGHVSSTVHIGPTAFLGVALSGQDVSGAMVEGVVQGGPADKAGLAAGDLITSFGGRNVTSPTSLQLLLRQASPGKAYRITWVDQYGNAAQRDDPPDVRPGPVVAPYRPVSCCEPARLDGSGEDLVVPLVLVGVRDREVGDRAVERVALAEVRRDREPVAPARVRPREGRSAEAAVERRTGQRQALDLDAALPVVELPDVVVAGLRRRGP